MNMNSHHIDGYLNLYRTNNYSSIPINIASKKTDGARAVAEASWQVPATTTQLSKINQGSSGSPPELIEQQLVGLRSEAGTSLYKVDFISNHKPDHDSVYRVDMLVLSSLLTKEVRTLTYWTDFDAEILLPKAPASSKLFVEDLLSPKVIVIGGNTEISSSAIGSASVSVHAKHSWPAVKKDQDDLVRMEATEDGEWKFWSIWKSGNRVFYYHGRIGDPSGSEGAYVSSSVRAAGGVARFMQQKVAEKTRKGYVKV